MVHIGAPVWQWGRPEGGAYLPAPGRKHRGGIVISTCQAVVLPSERNDFPSSVVDVFLTLKMGRA